MNECHKILHISKYYYPFVGGIEQVARDVVNAINDKYYIQKVICFNHDKGNKTDFVDDVEIIRVGCFTKISSQSLSFSYSRILGNIVKKFNPEIILLHYPNPFVTHFLLKLLKKSNIKLIVYWHLDITKQKMLGKLFHKQNIRLIKRANLVVGATPNHIFDSHYYEYFKNKYRILPYAINETRLRITNDELAKSLTIKKQYDAKIICFFIGRHVEYKGLEYLIKASKLLDNRFIFLIAGSGPLTDHLKKMASNDKKIIFIGKISDSDWRSYLYACDIFCFPSITKNEAFGLALAEAMYYKKPAVTFHINGSGVNYVNLKYVTGLEAENKNVEELANNLLILADNSSLRKQYGENAYNRIISNFTFDALKNNLKKILEDLENE